MRVEVAPLVRDIGAEITLVGDTAASLLGGRWGRYDRRRKRRGVERCIVRDD